MPPPVMVSGVSSGSFRRFPIRFQWSWGCSQEHFFAPRRRPPQTAAAILPFPEEASERAISVIHLEAKGKEKMKELEVMPVERSKTKKAQVSEEVIGPSASMEAEEEGTS